MEANHDSVFQTLRIAVATGADRNEHYCSMRIFLLQEPATFLSRINVSARLSTHNRDRDLIKYYCMRDRPQIEGTRSRSSMKGMARLSAIITILPASMAAGWVIGYYLVDQTLHIFPWGSLVLTLLGAGAGFFEIVKILIPGRRQDGRFDGKS